MAALSMSVFVQAISVLTGFRLYVHELEQGTGEVEGAKIDTNSSARVHQTTKGETFALQHRQDLISAARSSRGEGKYEMHHRATRFHSTNQTRMTLISQRHAGGGGSRARFRKSVLFFLSHVRAVHFIDIFADNAINLARSGAFKGKYSPHMVTADANPDAVEHNLASFRDNDSFLHKVFVACDKLLSMLFDKYIGDIKEAAVEKAITWLKNRLPDLVAIFLADCAKYINSVNGWVELTSNLIEAVKAASDTFKVQKLLAAGIVKGSPRLVIESIQEELHEYSLDNFKAVVQDVLMRSLEVANPVMGKVIESIKNLWDFLAEAFLHVRDLIKLSGIFADAQKHWNTKPRLCADAVAFRTWFTEVIKDTPIISSYILANPMTSNYKSFMCTVSAEASSHDDLTENLELFDKVKARAQQFVQDYSVQLTSTNAMVMHAIQLAHGEQPLMKGDVRNRIQKHDLLE